MNNLGSDGCAGGMRCKVPVAQHGHSLQATGNAAPRPPVQPECPGYSWTVAKRARQSFQRAGHDSNGGRDSANSRPTPLPRNGHLNGRRTSWPAIDPIHTISQNRLSNFPTADVHECLLPTPASVSTRPWTGWWQIYGQWRHR